MGTDGARDALAAWRASYPSDPFTSDRHLRSLLASVLPPDRLAERRNGPLFSPST